MAERKGNVRYPMTRHRIRSARRTVHARRSVGIGNDFEIARLQFAQRGLAGKELQTWLLGGEAGGKACRFGTVGRVGQFALGENPQQIVSGHLGQQPADAPDIDQVDAVAQSTVGIRGFHECPSRGALITRAQFMTPNPRLKTSARLPRNRVGDADRLSSAHPGSGWRSVAMPGTVSACRHSSASAASIAPAAAMVSPNAHLNDVTTGISRPNTRRMAAASERSDAAVPLPCATIKAISAGATPASPNASSIAAAIPSPLAPVDKTPAASVLKPAPRTSPRTRAPRAAAADRVSSTIAAAPSPTISPLLAASKGRIASVVNSPRR